MKTTKQKCIMVYHFFSLLASVKETLSNSKVAITSKGLPPWA